MARHNRTTPEEVFLDVTRGRDRAFSSEGEPGSREANASNKAGDVAR
jgi:hypothetical protein